MGREIMFFEVKDKNIYYSDRIWKNWIRCIPKDEEFIRKIIQSRNKIPRKLITMFNLSGKQQEEYNSAQNDEALTEIIIKDCKGSICNMSRVNTSCYKDRQKWMLEDFHN